MLGRVSSLDWLISIGLLPLSFALTGPVERCDRRAATLVGAGVLGAIVTFGALLLPGMRAKEGAAARARARRDDAPAGRCLTAYWVKTSWRVPGMRPPPPATCRVRPSTAAPAPRRGVGSGASDVHMSVRRS